MDKHFPDWYRSAALTPDAAILDARWTAVEDIARQSTAELVVKLASIFVMPTSTDEQVPVEFRDALRKRDATFPLRNNMQELRVLAGATLRLLITSQHETLSTLAALALVCGAFGPRSSTVPELDHIDAAHRFLVEYSTTTRSGTASPSRIDIPNLSKAKLNKLLPETLFNQATATPLREPVLVVLLEIMSGLSTALEQAQNAIDELVRTAEVRAEEVSILWWLHSRFSKHLQKSFSEIGYPAGALLFPLEVADLTALVPGSDSVPAIIVQALQLAGAPSSAEPIAIATATNALPRELREFVAKESMTTVPSTLTPISLAIAKSLETDGSDEWFPIYRRACDIAVDRPFPMAQLSMQLFYERMLVRAHAEAI